MADKKPQIISIGLLVLMFVLAAAQRPAWGGGDIENQSSDLDQVKMQYGSYAKYKDSGVLTITYYENGEEVRASKVQFSTSFDRSSDFQISWQDVLRNGDLGITYKIWSTSGIVLSQYGSDTPFQSESLSDALSRAVGISNSLTFYAPCLLMPKMDCFVCNDSIQFKVSSVGDSGGDEQTIDLVYQSGNIETLRVNKKTNQITMIEWWNEVDSMRVHHQIVYTTIEAE